MPTKFKLQILITPDRIEKMWAVFISLLSMKYFFNVSIILN